MVSITEPIDRDETALIIVDAQKAFASKVSPLADRGIDMEPMIETIPEIRTLLSAARSTDMPVVFTRSVRRADEKDAPRNIYDVCPGIYREGDPICLAGAPETAFLEGVEPTADEYTVEKQRYDAFVGTELDRYLRAESVSTVLIAGFATNVCVESTARSAHERGYNVLLVEDCCNAFDGESHRATVDTVESFLGDTVSLEAATRFLTD